MRIFRPKTVTLDGEKYEVHIDRRVYRRHVHRKPVRGKPDYFEDHVTVRRVTPGEEARVLAEFRRLTTPPPVSPVL